MALDWVLHARYMTPSVDRGSNNYGGKKFGGDCIDDDKKEAPFTSEAADVSRNSLQYFSSNLNIYLPGTVSGGITGTIETGNGNKQAVNRAVNFMGKDYVLIGDKIYVWDNDTLLWSVAITLTGKTAASTSSLGLYPVFINNAPHLTTAWSHANGTTWRWAKFNGITNTWTQASAASAGGLSINDTNGGVLTEVQHKNKIYYLTSSNTSFGVYDYTLGTFSTLSFSNTSRHPMDMCGFMDDLYILNKDGSDSIQMLKVVGAGTELEFNFDTGTPSNIGGIDILDTLTNTDNFEGRPLLFVDNVYDKDRPTLWMYYISHGTLAGKIAGGDSGVDTMHGLHAQAMVLNDDGDLVVKGVTGVQPIVGFRTQPWKMMQNQEENFGLPETITRKDEGIVLRTFVDQKDRGISGNNPSSIVCATRFAGQRCAGSPGGGGDFGNLMYHVFKGSGNADGGTHPNPPTAGGGQAHAFNFIGGPKKQVRHRAFPHSRLGGGGRHSEIVDNERIADIVYRGSSTTGQDGIVRILYSIIASTGNVEGSSVDTRWWHDKNGHAPETPCTLVGTSHGVLSGLLASNISINNSNTYYVDWDAKGDGVTRLSNITLGGQINLGNVIITKLDSPEDLSGLASWFDGADASSFSVNGSSKIATWADKAAAASLSGVLQATPADKPTFVTAGPSGVQFVASSSEYLFASGSPVTGDSTVIAIYEPASTSNGAVFSLSDDNASGITTSHEYWTMNTTASNVELKDQDAVRVTDGDPQRLMTLTDAGEINKTRMVAWRNLVFEGKGQHFPSGTLVVTDFTTDGVVDPSNLSNTTFGRFSGAQISGVYNPADYWDGILCEFVIYDRILSDSEIERFRLYADAKWTLEI